MNARGIAKFMLVGQYAARRVVEAYAFPKEDKAQIIRPVPAKEIVFDYFRNERPDYYLDAVIAENEVVPFGEKPFDQGRRRSSLNIAKHLLSFGASLPFDSVRKARPMETEIGGLPVRASIDFVCKVGDTVTAVIFNVSHDIADGGDIARYARIECEIAWQITRVHMSSVKQVWYVDALSERIVRKHAKSIRTEWRNIETACENILMQYHSLVARRAAAGRARA
jgi:hypothetical protein